LTASDKESGVRSILYLANVTVISPRNRDSSSPLNIIRFQIVQTKDVNVADEESNKEAVLLTNVLDLSMSNHQQPKQPIVMKLPIHSKVNDETEIVIFTSSKEYPEDVEDWEIIDATQDSRKKCAAFDIRHFSM
jgi:hypothetical protein